jgi:hypothetical protein
MKLIDSPAPREHETLWWLYATLDRFNLSGGDGCGEDEGCAQKCDLEQQAAFMANRCIIGFQHIGDEPNGRPVARAF